MDGALATAVSYLFEIPETMEKFLFSTPSSTRIHHHRQHHHDHDNSSESRGGRVSSIPADIVENDKEYVFFMDVPGLSKSDIQVTVEEDKILVIKSNGKRKREDGEEEGCKYIRLERGGPQKLTRKFRLPEDANVSAITAKCENGVLTVVVEKQPPPSKPKSVQVAIS